MAKAGKTTDLEAALARVERGERVTLRRGGKRFGLVTGADLDRLEALDRQEDTEEDADLLAACLEAEAEAREKGEEPVPWEDVKRRLGLA